MKLAVIFSFILSSNSISQVILTTSPKYYNYQNESVARHWNNVVNYDIKNTKTYNGRNENTQFKAFDSLSRITLERFILDRFNHYRKLRGAKSLVWDEDLRLLCFQHVTYQRLAGKQTHFQNEKDVPGFQELGYGTRHRKLCTDGPKFKNSSEGLINQSFQIKGNSNPDLIYPTYKMIVDLFFTLKFGYNTCELHWNDIMSGQWDSIFIYYDFNFVNATPDDWAYSNITIVFAEYEK
jgi:hypothetical protein